ncbi:MAG: universal stress protein [Bacteroidales bacterium]|nr:universal stress protein [Bacteroidales bacterium]
MNKKRILVPFDFTAAAESAAIVASSIALMSEMEITLIHVLGHDSESEADAQLSEMSKKITASSSAVCNYKIVKGKLFSEITNEANDQVYKLMVIGSHGYKGIKEMFQGADILKLVKSIPVPVLVIQEGYEFPPEGIKTILMPASSHDEFYKKIEAVVFLGRLFNSEVHVYTVEKPGFTWSETMKLNIEKAIREFEAKGIKYKRVNESQTAYSPGYSKQILQYAKKINAGMIAVMSVPTSEYYYIADSDKERLLTNDLRIPVFAVSDTDRV